MAARRRTRGYKRAHARGGRLTSGANSIASGSDAGCQPPGSACDYGLGRRTPYQHGLSAGSSGPRLASLVIGLVLYSGRLARVGPTHRRALGIRASKAPRARVPRAKAQPDRQKPRLARNRVNGFLGRQAAVNRSSTHQHPRRKAGHEAESGTGRESGTDRTGKRDGGRRKAGRRKAGRENGTGTILTRWGVLIMVRRCHEQRGSLLVEWFFRF